MIVNLVSIACQFSKRLENEWRCSRGGAEIGSREFNGIFIDKNYPKNGQSTQKTLILGSFLARMIQ